MAFLIYKKTANGQVVRYEKVKPLRLSGRDGIIAQHVKKLCASQTPSWKLGADALVKLAGLAVPGKELVVLFNVAGRDTANVCLYELSRIHGSSGDTSTQLALDFAVVVDKEIGDAAAEYANDFEIATPTKPKLLGETLALTGGSGGGDWKWTATSLQLGSTVVQPNRRNPPGKNCACGQRVGS
jgi:hypothetical protein